MNTLNTTQAGILAQVMAGHNTLGDVAEQLGVKVQVVTGNLAALKKHHLVDYADGHLSLTEAGIEMVEPKAEAVVDHAPVGVVADGQLTPEKEAVLEDLIADAKAAAAKKEEVVKESKVTKKQQAVAIIDSMAGARRKDIVAELVAQMAITPNNAGAYIQNHRKEQGLVVAREKKEAAADE